MPDKSEYQFNKLMLIPIVGVIALILKHSTGIVLDQPTQGMIADAIFFGFVIFGLFQKPKVKKRKKPPKPKVTPEEAEKLLP